MEESERLRCNIDPLEVPIKRRFLVSSTARLLPYTSDSISTIIVDVWSSKCSKSSPSRMYNLPSTGFTALSNISISKDEKETFGSAGRKASMTKSVIEIPVGNCQLVSLTELGCKRVSRIPAELTSG